MVGELFPTNELRAMRVRVKVTFWSLLKRTMKRPMVKHSTNEIVSKPSLERRVANDDQIETKMRILANQIIDRLFEIQEQAVKKGLNINKEKVTLIMEHSSNKT